MAGKLKRDADGVTHSKPGSIDSQVEDSFPASDAPSYSPGAIGAPENRKTPAIQAGDGHKSPDKKSRKAPKKSGG